MSSEKLGPGGCEDNRRQYCVDGIGGYVYGSISGCYATGDVSGGDCVGGNQKDSGGLYLGIFPLLEGTMVIDGSAVFGETLSGDTPLLTAFPYVAPVGLGDLTHTWYRDDQETAKGNTYTLASDDVGQMITLRVTSEHTSGWVVAVTGPVSKAAGPLAPNLDVEHATPGNDDGKITGLDAGLFYGYRMDGTAANTSISGAGEITGLAAKTYEVRLAETATHEAGAAAQVTVQQRYRVTVTSASVGSIMANVGTALPDEIVTLTVTADEDYHLSSWTTVPDDLLIVGNGDTYTFTMPIRDFTVTTHSSSSAYNVLSVITPEDAAISGTEITASVPNGTNNLTVELTVSPDATWKLYSDAACNGKMADKAMNLRVGANTAYVRVTAQDGISTKVYTLPSRK